MITILAMEDYYKRGKMINNRIRQYTSFFSEKCQQARIHASKMMESESAVAAKTSFNYGIKKCASVVSDQLEVAQSQMSKALKSDITSQTKVLIVNQYEKCKTAVSDQCAALAASDTTKQCASAMTGIAESGIVLDVKARLQQCQSLLAEKCQQTISKTKEVLTSKTVTEGRHALEEGLKTTIGVHCLFDLALTLFQMTSPFYTALEMIKYFCVGFAFVIATYKAYDQGQSDLNTQEELMFLEKEIQDIVEELNPKQKEFINSIKYFMNNKDKTAFTEKDHKVIHHSSAAAFVSDVLDSTPSLYIKSCVDAASTSSIYSYGIEIGTSILPQGLLVKLLKNFLSVAVIAESALSAYRHNESELNAKLKLAALERKLLPAYEKLQINQGEASGPSIEVTVQDNEIEKVRSRISVLAETEPALYLGSTLGAATFASSVFFALEKMPSHLFMVRYLFSITTLLVSAYVTYTDSKNKIQFQERVDELTKNTESLQDFLVTVKIITQRQQNYSSFFKEKPIEISPQPLAAADPTPVANTM